MNKFDYVVTDANGNEFLINVEENKDLVERLKAYTDKVTKKEDDKNE